MIKMKSPRSAFIWIVFAVFMVGTLFAASTADAIFFKRNPIVFVHGGSGSGAQFESQAMRFTSNGYSRSEIGVVEYDSAALVPGNPAADAIVVGLIDAEIDRILAETHSSKVDLMGHSRGTQFSQVYLSDPGRAAKVAHYVNIDGAPAAAPPGGVPTLALWAGAARPVQPVFGGANNVTIPNQEHVQTATSAESFAEMYKFLQGRPPFTTKPVPDFLSRISGRAVLFPQNTGLNGATVEVWLVKGSTGERIGGHPVATFAIGPDGNFGPFIALFGKHYELAVLQAGQADILYFYEPFVRSDHLVRLSVAAGLNPFITSSPNSTALSVVRFKEFWGDRGAENDVLSINGTDVINAVTAPSGAVGIAPVAFFLFDVGADGVNNLTTIPFPFGPLAFLTGADLFIPANPPGTVSVVTVPRGDASKTRTVNVRNEPSSTARVVVQLRDFEDVFGFDFDD